MPRMYKKLEGKAVGRLSAEPSKATQYVLEYVLSHARSDDRPYLKVSILGLEIMGLLDSGATRTILGGPGWKILGKYCELEKSSTLCTVANGDSCESIGMVQLPIRLQDRVRILKVLVVPALPSTLILGIDFWTKMEIIPNLNTGEWHFLSKDHITHSISAIQDIDTLTAEQRDELDNLVNKVFTEMGDKIGCTHLVEHVIQTNSPPIKQRYYPLSPAMQKIVNEELDFMIENDIVEPSTSPWSSPIVMVQKKDGKWRFCVNYKRLNAVSIPDAYPLPYISDTIDKLRDARYMTSLDIKSAYWQIPVAEKSRPLTAFTVPNRGLFQFKRLPFGLHSAPATWQRFADKVLRADLEKYVFIYLDDIIIVTNTFDKHLEVLRELFKRLKEAGITLNREKCEFCRPELRYLGYCVNSAGLLVDPQKIEAILKIPSPKNIKEVRQIVGLASWYRRFIPSFSTLCDPLTKLTRKNVPFIWDKDCEEALNNLKQHLVSAPILACPDFNLPFQVETDASDFGLGAVLLQKQNREDKVICYLSRSLTKTERKYSTTEKELLAVLFAVEKLRPYLQGTKFTVVTDHYSLKWLFNIKDPAGRIARWALRLQQFDFDVVHRPGKDHLVPDTLSRTVPIINVVEDEDIRVEDSTDKWYTTMCNRVTDKPHEYPLWLLENGRLYRKTKLRYPELQRKEWLMVVPKEKRQEIIRNHHDPPTCGHLGVSKTLARITRNFYWPKCHADVSRYVKNCQVCVQTKPEQKLPIGQMLSAQPTAMNPWDVLSIDIVGPLPRSNSGFVYILSVLDCFSKYILFFPMRSAKAQNVIKNLEDNVFLVYGAPKRIITDNGAQFKGKEFKSLMSRYKIKFTPISNFHPQANPVERVHRVLKTMLTAYVSENHKLWDTYLAKVGYAIRSAKHDVTDVSPNFVIFGRDIDLNDMEFDNDDKPSSSAGKQEALDELFKDIRSRLKLVYDKSKIRYNLRHRNEPFSLHQLVWKKNYTLSDASKNYTAKLAPKFNGPFKIVKIHSPYSYELADLNNKPVGIWNAKDIKAHPPDE